MIFEWDDKKNSLNLKKHGISFEEAREVFHDPLHLSVLDLRYNTLEERWLTLGCTSRQQIIVVANLFFTDEGEQIIRIISARKATVKERNTYEKY